MQFQRDILDDFLPLFVLWYSFEWYYILVLTGINAISDSWYCWYSSFSCSLLRLQFTHTYSHTVPQCDYSSIIRTHALFLSAITAHSYVLTHCSSVRLLLTHTYSRTVPQCDYSSLIRTHALFLIEIYVKTEHFTVGVKDNDTTKTANIKIVVLQSWHIFTTTRTIAMFYLKCKIVRTCDFCDRNSLKGVKINSR